MYIVYTFLFESILSVVFCPVLIIPFFFPAVKSKTLSRYLSALNSGDNCMQATWEHILKPLLDADNEHKVKIGKLDFDLDRLRTDVAILVQERDAKVADLTADNAQLRRQLQHLSERLNEMDGSSTALTDHSFPTIIQPVVPYFGLVSKTPANSLLLCMTCLLLRWVLVY